MWKIDLSEMHYSLKYLNEWKESIHFEFGIQSSSDGAQIVYLSTLKDSIVDSDKYKLHRQDFHLQQSVWEIEDWTFNFRQIIERKYKIDNFKK